MAKFCTLCGYEDINIKQVYDTYFKTIPTLKQTIETLGVNYYSSNLGGTCEHCGISSIGINSNFEVFAGFGNVKPQLKIGEINKETLEITIFDNLPEYEDQREFNKKKVKPVVENIQITPNSQQQKPLNLRNMIEDSLDLNDVQIEVLYHKWLGEDMTDVGLCEILLFQLMMKYKEEKGSDYKNEFQNIILRYGKTKKDVIRKKV